MTDDTTIELVSGGRNHVLRRASVVAGRADGCDLHVVQPLVSREHCRIEARTEGVFVFDLGSHNGTWVNGERIDAVRRIRAGDRIRLGAEGVEFVLARALVDGRDVADLASDTNANTADLGDAHAARQPARISVRPTHGAHDAPAAAPPPGPPPPRPPRAEPPPIPPDRPRADAAPPRRAAPADEPEPVSAEIVAPLPSEPDLARDIHRAPPPRIETDCRGALGGPSRGDTAPPAPPPSPAAPPAPAPRIGLVRRAALFLAGVTTGVALVAALAVFTDFPERLARVLPLLGIANPAHEDR